MHATVRENNERKNKKKIWPWSLVLEMSASVLPFSTMQTKIKEPSKELYYLYPKKLILFLLYRIYSSHQKCLPLPTRPGWNTIRAGSFHRRTMKDYFLLIFSKIENRENRENVKLFAVFFKIPQPFQWGCIRPGHSCHSVFPPGWDRVIVYFNSTITSKKIGTRPWKFFCNKILPFFLIAKFLKIF